MRTVLSIITALASSFLVFWFSSGNIALAIFIGCMVFLIARFTSVTEEVVDILFDCGGAIVKGLAKVLDHL